MKRSPWRSRGGPSWVVSSRSRFAQPESPFLDSGHRRARRRGAGPSRGRDISAGVGSRTGAGSNRRRKAAVDGHVLRSCRLEARARIASTGRGRFGSVGRRGSEDRPGFRYVLIAHSSAAFRASRTASFFLIAAISLRILCNSLWDFLLSKYSEPSCATMYRSNWLLRTLR